MSLLRWSGMSRAGPRSADWTLPPDRLRHSGGSGPGFACPVLVRFLRQDHSGPETRPGSGPETRPGIARAPRERRVGPGPAPILRVFTCTCACADNRALRMRAHGLYLRGRASSVCTCRTRALLVALLSNGRSDQAGGLCRCRKYLPLPCRSCECAPFWLDAGICRCEPGRSDQAGADTRFQLISGRRRMSPSFFVSSEKAAANIAQLVRFQRFCFQLISGRPTEETEKTPGKWPKTGNGRKPKKSRPISGRRFRSADRKIAKIIEKW